MGQDIHIAVTRIVREGHLAEFERLLEEFAARSLAEPGSRGVQLLYPPRGSGSREYGILRSFSGEAERESFYRSPLYQEWSERVAPLTEGPPVIRRLTGLEAWFRHPDGVVPPRWKMALLTWIAVWPVSLLVPPLLIPHIGSRLPAFLVPGVVSAGIVAVLTWIAMPLLVKAARPWLHSD